MKSAYISRSDLFSRIKVGNVTFVRSMPTLTCDSMYMIRLLLAATVPVKVGGCECDSGTVEEGCVGAANFSNTVSKST